MRPFEPIAIVGQACVLPGAHNPTELWEKVAAGADLISTAPADRWGLKPQTALTPDPSKSGDKAWSDRGGYVHGFEELLERTLTTDPFRTPADQVRALDPLFQWVLWTGREAVRDAGLTSGARTGAIFGNLSFPSSAMSRFAEATWLGARAKEAVDPLNRYMSGLPAQILANELGLDAGAYTLDAACASSLYAIKLACDRLHDREVDAMLAGAVCRSDDLFIHVGFCALNAMSKTGRSRPFHAGADGLVPGEGCAFVVLKRLSDAEAAGDRILGVIRGAGLSNDGRGRGLLAPSSDGQVRAMEHAFVGSGLKPSDVSYIECHATGTSVGDATELRSMARVYGTEGMAIGSLKSNMGHLITAAGAAGLIKVLGAFKNGQKPPTLHVDDPNPVLGETGLNPVLAPQPWEGPRIAGVSAFGFGGNNAHILVQEYTGPIQHAASTPVSGDIALTAMTVTAGSADGTRAFHSVVNREAHGITAGEGRASDIGLPLKQLKFPPNDLQQTLPQQLLILRAAMRVAEGRNLDPNRTGVFIGSQSDPEVCRYGARWRLADWAAEWGADEAWTATAKDAIVPLLKSAGVVGNMPNIPANRINSQLDLGGPGFIVSREELSGLTALKIALRMLRAGELDTALVGAVDLSCEDVHKAASGLLGADRRTPGDAAVVLLLERADDAKAAGHSIVATFPLPRRRCRRGVRTQRRPPGRPDRTRPRRECPGPRCCRSVGRTRRSRDRTGRLRQPGRRAGRHHPGRPHWISEEPGRRADVGRRAAAHPARPSPGREDSADAPAAHEWNAGHGPRAVPSQRDGRFAGRADGCDRVRARSRLEAAACSSACACAGPCSGSGSGCRCGPGSPAPGRHPDASGSDRQPDVRLRGRAGQHARQLHGPAVGGPSSVPAGASERDESAPGRLAGEPRRDDAHGTRSPAPPMPAPAPAPAPKPIVPPAPKVVKPPAPKPAPKPVEPPKPAPKPAPKAESKPSVGTLDYEAVIHPPADLPGPKYGRAELEILASDKLSKVYPKMFEIQDDFPRQVRMPEPPLLLCDRVTGIDAEPGSMTTGTIWTESDVTWDDWYLHEGHMPAGIMIESGQADLLLISWLGADFQNKGERVYRLLGCELTYHGGLPQPGDTLKYDIHVDGHANQGDTRIFFFHYDCRVDGKLRLAVRQGQAGFFSDAELANSGGILWTPETAELVDNPRVDPPAVRCTKTSFTGEELTAFTNGDGFACFGEGFEYLQAHVRTPRSSPEPMQFFSEITHCEPEGGPWGRGYLRAVQKVHPNDWHFDGHFKDDPCMPGTLMFEACLQAAGFYMASLGYTIDKDGWRFEPVPDVPYQLKCRGQVTPESKEVIYEVFVEEVWHDGKPTIWVDFLCTCDGLKAFHARRVGLQLTPDWPISSRPEWLTDYVEPKPVAKSADGFAFGYDSLMACAWGKPSHAFGPMYEPFDQGRHCARLPGPPYHFMSRLVSISQEPGLYYKESAKAAIGCEIELEYDIPEDSWYFDENGNRTMPFAVLLEAALQPCGWIASYIGSAR